MSSVQRYQIDACLSIIIFVLVTLPLTTHEQSYLKVESFIRNCCKKNIMMTNRSQLAPVELNITRTTHGACVVYK